MTYKLVDLRRSGEEEDRKVHEVVLMKANRSDLYQSSTAARQWHKKAACGSLCLCCLGTSTCGRSARTSAAVISRRHEDGSLHRSTFQSESEAGHSSLLTRSTLGPAVTNGRLQKHSSRAALLTVTDGKNNMCPVCKHLVYVRWGWRTVIDSGGCEGKEEKKLQRHQLALCMQTRTQRLNNLVDFS